jgi:GDP-mannose 6-dehydrogenase
MKIAVLGLGTVGAVMCGCLAGMGHRVFAVDLDAHKVDLVNRGLSPVLEPRLQELIADAWANARLQATQDAATAIRGAAISFVCVGTPKADDGSALLIQVEQVIGAIGDALRETGHDHTVVMCSTVPPGTAENVCIPFLEARSGRRYGQGLRYVASPEFLREGSAVRDFAAPPMILAGVNDAGDADVLRQAYHGIDAPFRIAPYRTAESVKLLSNVYHALKVAFANEAAAVLAAHDVDARDAFAHFCADDVLNISAAYLRPGFAFGGACLPKDLSGFLAIAKAASVPTPLLGQVLASNQATIDRAVQLILSRGKQPIALLGLTFKPDIDDLRGSPYVELARRLLAAGIDLRIFDTALVPRGATSGDPVASVQREAPDLAHALVYSAREALAGSELLVISHRGAASLDTLRVLLTDQEVIDLDGNSGLGALVRGSYRAFV